jgi:FixJ family two-component response regulator
LVLIVDDDQAVRDALQFALQIEGLSVHAHSRGADLLEDPDLASAGCLIVDEQMPRMDGFMVLNNLRERNIGLPAIMLTSHATARVRARAEAAGARKLLEKPLLDNALMENIRCILNAN